MRNEQLKLASGLWAAGLSAEVFYGNSNIAEMSEFALQRGISALLIMRETSVLEDAKDPERYDTKVGDREQDDSDNEDDRGEKEPVDCVSRFLASKGKVLVSDYKLTLRFLSKGSKERDQHISRSEVVKYFQMIKQRGRNR